MRGADREPRGAKPRPDPRPMRLALGMGGLVAATAMATAIVRVPSSAVVVADPVLPDPTPAPTVEPAPAKQVVIKQITRYVQLKPGETAPPGAKVVKKPDPSPRVVVITVPAPTARPAPRPAARPAPAPRRVVVTRQSGG